MQPECGLNTDYAIRVVAKKALALLGNSQDFWSLLIIKLAFKLKPLKYLFFVRFNFGGAKRGVVS